MTATGPNGAFFKGPRATKIDPKVRKAEDESVYRKNHLKALVRETGRCQCCRRKATNTHHMRKRSRTRNMPPEYRHDADYLLVVCGSGTTGCHGEIEAEQLKVYNTALAPTFERWDGVAYVPWAPMFGSAK